VEPSDDPRRMLARRLRTLRLEEWPGVTVTTTKITKNQIQVTISKKGQQFFSKLFVPGGEQLKRSANAQYNLPIPLGSPRNYIGTAAMGHGSGAYSREGVAASINGYCTDKVQGDQKASRYFPITTDTSSAWTEVKRCVGPSSSRRFTAPQSRRPTSITKGRSRSTRS